MTFLFRFNFGGGGGESREPRLFHKQSITSKVKRFTAVKKQKLHGPKLQAYWNNILPGSERQPYLILFYSDWCFGCLRVEPIWSK